jgi:hypothetical protein
MRRRFKYQDLEFEMTWIENWLEFADMLGQQKSPALVHPRKGTCRSYSSMKEDILFFTPFSR